MLVGTSDSKLYSILVKDDNSTSQLGMLDFSGNGGGHVSDIAIKDGFAYLTMDLDNTATPDVWKVDVSNPVHLTIAGGIGLQGNAAAKAVSLTNSALLLGRALGNTLPEYEVSVYNLTDIGNVTQGVSAKGQFDIAGTVTKTAVTLDGSFAFIASNAPNSQLRVVNIQDPSNPSVVGLFNAHETMSAVYYDPTSNRFFAVSGSDDASKSSFYIFIPG